MKIEFFIDDVHHEGTAVPFERPGSTDTEFVVRLKDLPVFHVRMSAAGEWISDDNRTAGIVAAVGSEIARRDENENLSYTSPGEYHSDGTTDAYDIVKNGEIVNEPDDVEEKTFSSPENTQP